MSTSVTFETATIADVLNKAGRVAPKKNSPAFSQAPGVYIHVLDDQVIVRATDTALFITQWTNFISKDGEAVDWHLSNGVIDFCANLPTGRGKTVTFSDEKHGFLTLTQGRTVATTPQIRSGYPNWEAYDEEKSTVVQGLGAQLESVLWACAKDADNAVPALTGVYLSGTHAAASNGTSAAMVPLDIPDLVGNGVTVPASDLAALVRHAGDVRLCSVKSGLGISPDQYTQIICRSFAENKIAKMNSPREFQHTIQVNTEQVAESVQRMLAILKKVDNPQVKVFIANEEILLTMQGNDKQESVHDVVSIPGFAIDTVPALLNFDPEILLNAMAKSPGHSVSMHYNDNSPLVYLNSPGYEAWFAQKTGIPRV